MKKGFNISRLMELLQIGQDPEPDEYDCSRGWFEDDLTFHWDPEFPYERLFVWEWVLYPEIVRYAESKGIAVPENPPIDLSKTF